MKCIVCGKELEEYLVVSLTNEQIRNKDIEVYALGDMPVGMICKDCFMKR